MRLIHLFGSAVLLGGMALQAQATIGWGNIQWPPVGSNQPSNADITVYSQVWKAGCTDTAGPCTDIVGTLYYKKPSDGAFTSVAMSYNTDSGSNDENMGMIPMAALTEAQVQFYIEYLDTSDSSLYYPDGYDSTSPAFYNVVPTTSVDFTLSVCVDLSCVGVGDPGIAGTFNGWGFTGLNATGDPDVYCGEIVIPAGSSPELYFKFRNPGVEDWEGIGDRQYVIAQSATAGSYDAFWNNDDSCLSANTEDLPGAFALGSAYPNPFNPSTSIDFSLAETGEVSLRVTDLLGRTVSTLVEGMTSAGEHSVTFHAEGLGSGVYFYTLEAAGQSQTRKLVLLK